jgi:hypothetical protein
LMETKKQGMRERERKRGQGPNIPYKAHFQWPNSFPLGSTFLRFHHLPTAPQAGDQVFTPGPFGDI